jgi:hypothetical protein
MSNKWEATFHGPSGARTFIGVCGVGEPTEVTPSAAAGLEKLGWVKPEALERLLDKTWQDGYADRAREGNAA